MASILVVDDDASDRAFLQIVLETDGHDTHLAADGDEALASLADRAIDVVVTDLQMPKMHGLELISLLRDRIPRPAIVAVSGTGEPQLDVAGAVGADTTLTKPVSPEALLDGVRKALAATAQRAQGGGA